MEAQSWKPGSLALSAIALQLSFLVTILFDISVARQVIGFIFLTWMPGYTIVRLAKLKLGRVDLVLFSMGLSLSFLMISAFLMNLILPGVGVVNPLSSVPILIIVNLMTLTLIITEWRSSATFEFNLPPRRLLSYGTLFFLLPIILTLVGVSLVRIPPHTANVTLLIMMVTIAGLVVLSLLPQKFFPRELFPILLLAITISLLLHTSLFSSHLQGGDIFGEYDVFRFTLSDLYWNPSSIGRLSSMLSVTVLPTMYSLVLNLDPVWVFKLVFPLLFAFVPLALYQMFKSKVGVEVAFFSAFFFISNLVFFTELPQLARQMIGELFFALLFLTLFHPSVKGAKRWVLFLLFGIGLVVSHYAMAYIFLGLVGMTWLITRTRMRRTKISVSFIILIGIVIFAWYIYTSQASNFNDLLGTITNVSSNFASDFFNAGSRGAQVLQVVGVTGISTFWHSIGRVFYYAAQGLIVAGLAYLVFRDRISFFKDSYNSLILLNFLLLGACIVVPNFSRTFNATRFYHVALFFLAPLILLGGLFILRTLSRKRLNRRRQLSILVLFLLIPYFLFQVGFVYEVTYEESYSLPLASYRIDPLVQSNLGLLTDAEVRSGEWLYEHAAPNNTVIYNDVSTQNILVYTKVAHFLPSTSFTTAPIPSRSYVYIREYNLAHEVVFSENSPYGVYNITDIEPSLSDMGLVYSSGSCEVYYVP